MFDADLLLHGQYHDWLLHGLAVSLKLTGLVFVLALPLAVLVALLRLAPVAPLRAAGWFYVEGIRGVPLLAHLLFWYFGAPELLPDGPKEWLYAHDVEFASAAVALTLYTAAYMAEDIRSGIRAVPAVQFEAGRSLGFGFLATMRLVVLPQALRITVPPLLSQTLNLWKDTSIATVVGVGELMYQAARVESASFRSLEAFAFASAAYLTVSLVLTALAAVVQRRWPARQA
ncbi:amino acid ABC transporter permease [Rubrivivax gelatinosus]|uniref:Putative ABC transporter permease n=1 Tax=Rubrivivax gelatinosus (strain NBRC 100245 / IL144) TaxID=983917 RepID=I0HSA2_RUBGI|nr:amino acid ABC transporter permease [Rubrivivax gelatinosus]MBG6082418.1 polar amino acid transport system permease protein [Rubrivivax gelatinosus]BAL95889.1 putative ABC transporter permease [Rubrivivax gelatinosus IL144]